jgi:putative transposase
MKPGVRQRTSAASTGSAAAPFYKWKSKFGGMDVSDAKRLRSLEDENAKRKKLLAETMLDNAILKDVNSRKWVTPAARRQAVAHVCEAHDVSERRACTALDLDRSTIRYRSRRPDDAGLRQRIRELAAIRRRFGYRRLHFLLCKEGLHMNQKRFRRLYREEGLAVRKRGGRKRGLGRASATRASLAPQRALEPGLRFRLSHGRARRFSGC